MVAELTESVILPEILYHTVCKSRNTTPNGRLMQSQSRVKTQTNAIWVDGPLGGRRQAMGHLEVVHAGYGLREVSTVSTGQFWCNFGFWRTASRPTVI